MVKVKVKFCLWCFTDREFISRPPENFHDSVMFQNFHLSSPVAVWFGFCLVCFVRNQNDRDVDIMWFYPHSFIDLFVHSIHKLHRFQAA